MQNKGTDRDSALQLQRACEEISGAFGQLATREETPTVDDWQIACEALREILNAATGQLVRASHAQLLASELEPAKSA